MNQNLYFQRGIQIISRLNEITPQAYLVGGVVRDYLLNLPFNDIDIATTATPEQIMKLFPGAIQEFAEYGCITLKEEGMIFEITTFREENYAKMSRKPSEIHYSKKLLDDIMRRDYTINALAMPKSLILVDLVNGEKDLQNRLIRIIGNPKVRYKEDPLRILRGLGLMAKLNFTIESKTLRGMIKCRKNLNEIANVKLTGELTNVFNQPYGKKTVKFINRYMLFRYVKNYQKWLKIIYRKYDKLSTLEKFTILYKMEHQIPENTCFNKETLQKIREIIELTNYLEREPITEYEVYKYDINCLMSADLINTIMLKKYKSQAKNIQRMVKKSTIKSKEDINFRPANLIALASGKTGKFVGEIMSQIEQWVVCGKIENDYNVISEKAKEMLKIYDFSEKSETVVEQIEVDDSQVLISSLLNESNSEMKPAFLETINEECEDELSSIQVEESVEYQDIAKKLDEPVNHQEISTRKIEPENLLENKIPATISNLNIFQNEQYQPDIIDYQKLLSDYQKEFNKMMDRRMLHLIDENTTIEEMDEIKNKLKPSIRLLTIKSNPQFEILMEKGLI